MFQNFSVIAGCLLALSWVLPAAASQERTVGAGDIFVVEAPPGEGLPLWAELMGQRFPAIAARENGKTFFLLGVDLETAPGVYPLSVHFSSARGDREMLDIVVQKRDFPLEELTLPEKMVTPPKEVLDRTARERKAAAAVYADSSPEAVWSPPFRRPVEGVPSGNFGRRRILNGLPKSPHSGEDYKADRGAKVTAVARGEVRMAQDLYYSGKTILLDHGAGLVTQYFHLEGMLVEEGQVVERGEVIGKVGATGRVTGPHLHFGIRLFGMRSDPSLLWELFPD